MPERFLIIGLGNPGQRYKETRHNAGFMVVDRLVRECEAGVKKSRFSADLASADFKGHSLLLAKPQTYMNLSGIAAARLVHYFKIDHSKLLVILDDIHLPLGKIRLRAQGSAGGHNGLDSIIDHLATQDFARLRLGIHTERKKDDLADYVLSRFGEEERAVLDDMVQRAAEAVKSYITEGIEIAMTHFNG
jgi:PTH1 family peptidyl-tRNA hydrolase